MWRYREGEGYRYGGMGAGRGSEGLLQREFKQCLNPDTDHAAYSREIHRTDIDNFRVADFIFYWNYYEQPCSLLLQKPKTEGLTAIKMVVDSDEAASFLLRAKEKTGCRLYQVD